MNRIAIANLSEVRAMARGDLAGTVGGLIPLPGRPVPSFLAYLRCLAKAKTPAQRLFCRIVYGPKRLGN